jgi:hypothetical protein
MVVIPPPADAHMMMQNATVCEKEKGIL